MTEGKLLAESGVETGINVMGTVYNRAGYFKLFWYGERYGKLMGLVFRRHHDETYVSETLFKFGDEFEKYLRELDVPFVREDSDTQVSSSVKGGGNK